MFKNSKFFIQESFCTLPLELRFWNLNMKFFSPQNSMIVVSEILLINLKETLQSEIPF